MIIRLPRTGYKLGQEFRLLLMSDLHLEDASCDRDKLLAELQWGKDNDAVILLNGDVVSLLLPKDVRRYVPSELAPELSRKDAVLNEALDLATEILAPYSANIHMVGCGNHEAAVTKHHSVDITALLVERLNAIARQKRKAHTIYHGGYTGAVVWPFSRGNGGSVSFAIWYHHGMGASAPVTKGLIDFNRAATYVRNADVIWLGHKHNRYAVQSAELRIPTKGDELREHYVWHIMTGAYNGRPEQLDDRGHYQVNWATERGFAPQGKGGIKLRLKLRHPSRANRAVIDSEVIL